MPEIFHTLNRGVDKRKIFMDDDDYLRFVHNLFEFNDVEPVNNLTYFLRYNPQSKDIASPYIARARMRTERRPRELLVNVHAFCLMPNHYHLLLSPLKENGITLFMKKLNIGYAKYFNEKYERVGALFQGRYKSVAVKTEEHFVHLPYYIHLNPLDLFAPEWRNREIRDHKKALKFLESYRWSSHHDYLGKKNFPSVTQREFLSEFFGGPKEYEKSISLWLKELDLGDVGEVSLE